MQKEGDDNIMKGKDKCKALKEIRAKIANENDIELVTKECQYQGDCAGTCPACEAELCYLEEELEKKRKAGKLVATVGLAIGLSVGLTGCDGSLSRFVREVEKIDVDNHDTLTEKETEESEKETETVIVDDLMGDVSYDESFAE